MKPLKTVKRLIEYRENCAPKPKLQPPSVLQFPINNICNSRCQMCDIWKQKKGSELSPDQIRTILGNRLYQNLKHVGINGGEPTLRRDFTQVVETILTSLPKLAGITLITNAIQAKNVITQANSFASQCKAFGVSPTVMVSLDGVGSLHETVRGRKGNFDTAQEVIHTLKKNPDLDGITIGCTIIKENARHTEELLAWAIENDVYARFRLGIPHQRLYSDDQRNAFQLDEDDRFHIANFLDYLRLRYEKNPVRQQFYLSLRNQLIYRAPRTAGCPWRNRGATLLSDGNLAYCAVESPSLGSALEADSHELYWTNDPIRNEILENKCANCLHDYDGVSQYSVLKYIIKSEVRATLPERARALAEEVQDRIWTRQATKRLDRASPPGGPPVKTKKGCPILLCGWYGTETLGDKAILSAIVSTIQRRHPERSVALASLEPFVSEYTARQMPELATLTIHPIDEALEKMRQGRFSAVAVAGGPLMATVREITKLAELVTIARSYSIPTALLGCGIGPLGGQRTRDRTGRVSIKALLNNSNTIVTRDQASVVLASQQAPNALAAKAIVDPAFLWAKEQALSEAPIEKPYLLLCLREWQVDEYATGMTKAEALQIKERFESNLIECIDAFVTQNPETMIVPFCMHKREVGGDDRFFYNRLFRNHPHILSHLDYLHRNPTHDFSWFQHARAVLCMRFHSYVFALAANRPCRAIDYTMGGKISGLAKDLGTYEEHIVPITGFNPQREATKLGEAIKRRNSPANPALDSRIQSSREILEQAVDAVCTPSESID